MFLNIPRERISTENNLKRRWLEWIELKGGITIEVLDGT
jgi:hypothetical protein